MSSARGLVNLQHSFLAGADRCTFTYFFEHCVSEQRVPVASSSISDWTLAPVDHDFSVAIVPQLEVLETNASRLASAPRLSDETSLVDFVGRYENLTEHLKEAIIRAGMQGRR